MRKNKKKLENEWNSKQLDSFVPCTSRFQDYCCSFLFFCNSSKFFLNNLNSDSPVATLYFEKTDSYEAMACALNRFLPQIHHPDSPFCHSV